MKLRILTACVGIPIVVAMVLCSYSWPFVVLVVGLAAIGCYELVNFYTKKARGGFILPSPGFVLAAFAIAFLQPKLTPELSLPFLWILFLIGVGAAWSIAKDKRNLVLLSLARFWIYAPLLTCIAWHAWSARTAQGLFSLNTFLLMLLPLWAADIAAMLIGKFWGKHKLAPNISPGKTWEGAAANLVMAIITAGSVGIWLSVPIWKASIVGFFIGACGQLGDLFESALKRSSGLKDSGSILPGHGGVLDRIDSLLFSALPAFTFFFFF